MENSPNDYTIDIDVDDVALNTVLTVDEINKVIYDYNESIKNNFEEFLKIISTFNLFRSNVSKIIRKTNDESLIEKFDDINDRIDIPRSFNNGKMLLPYIPTDNDSQDDLYGEINQYSPIISDGGSQGTQDSNSSISKKIASLTISNEDKTIENKTSMRKRKNTSNKTVDNESKKIKNQLSDDELLKKLQENYKPFILSTYEEIPDIPNNLGEIKLDDIVEQVKNHFTRLHTVNSLSLLNSYRFGRWLNETFYKHKSEKEYNTQLPDWSTFVKERFDISLSKSSEYRQFSKRFHNYPKIFKTGLPFYFFRGEQGGRIAALLDQNNNYETYFK